MFFSRSGVGPALRNNAQSAQATAESGVGTAERRARERDTHLSLRATCDCGGNGMGGEQVPARGDVLLQWRFQVSE